MNILEQVSLFAEKHKDVALVTVVSTKGSTPRHPGAHMLVCRCGEQNGTIGGGRVEQELVAAAQQVAASGGARLVQHNLVQDLAMCCGGTMRFYIEPLEGCRDAIDEALLRRAKRQSSLLVTDLRGGGKQVVTPGERATSAIVEEHSFEELIAPRTRLILFGCGHLSKAIGPMARELDFEVVVCDDNETSAVEGAPSWANEVVESFELRDIEKRVGRLGARDYLLILTRDHGIDQKIVESTLPRVDNFGYLGLIGSMGKVGRFRKRVLAKGHISEEQWEQLRAPIGLDIAAETPREIAISILAELVARRNGK